MADCCTHITPGLQVNVQKYDPSGTLSLQNVFARELRRRFINLEKVIIQAVVTQDCFGLKEQKLTVHAKNNTTPPGDRAFAFPRSADKITEFNKWLQRQIEKEILEVTEMKRVGTGVEAAWTNKYITDSYKRGLIRSQYDLKKIGLPIPTGEKAVGFEALLNTPLHVDRLGLLYTRTFSDLKGITSAMDTQISRVLAQGIADGDNPRLLARKLLSTINGTGMGDLGITDTLGRFIPARTRAELLARTEIMRAHHQAMIQEYRNWGVLGVTVNVEWVAGKDARVCEKCQELDGKIFTLDEIENRIPAHPRCRCSIVAKFVKPEKKQEVVKPKPELIIPFSDADTVKWDKAKTAAEIAEQLRSKFLIEKTKGITNAAGDILRGNIFGESISRIFTLLPGLRTKTSAQLLKNPFRVMVDALHFDKTVVPLGYKDDSGVLAVYTRTGTKKAIRLGTRATVRTTNSLTLGDFNNNVGTDLATIVRHEYGHHVYFKLLSVGDTITWERFYKEVGPGFFRNDVSWYAAKDAEEAFAESFAAYTSPMHGVSPRNTLPANIIKIFDKILGKRL